LGIHVGYLDEKNPLCEAHLTALHNALRS